MVTWICSLYTWLLAFRNFRASLWSFWQPFVTIWMLLPCSVRLRYRWSSAGPNWWQVMPSPLSAALRNHLAASLVGFRPLNRIITLTKFNWPVFPFRLYRSFNIVSFLTRHLLNNILMIGPISMFIHTSRIQSLWRIPALSLPLLLFLSDVCCGDRLVLSRNPTLFPSRYSCWSHFSCSCKVHIGHKSTGNRYRYEEKLLLTLCEP